MCGGGCGCGGEGGLGSTVHISNLHEQTLVCLAKLIKSFIKLYEAFVDITGFEDFSPKLEIFVYQLRTTACNFQVYRYVYIHIVIYVQPHRYT